MKRIIFTYGLFLGIIGSVWSQDMHFSQYYASPLTLNPALTANINGAFRATFNYRGQWFSIPTFSSASPYTTFQGSVDFPILRNKLREDGFGFGVAFYSDEAGNGSLTTQAGMASIAYHLAVDRYGRSRISLGFQAGIISKRIFEHDLLFEEQFDPGLNAFNPFAPNGENFEQASFVYPDMNLGVLWSSLTRKNTFSYYLGFSVNHIATPGESFLGGNNEIARRYVAHAGAEVKVGKYTKIFPTFFYTLQSQSQQFNLGSGLQYDFSDNMAGFVGFWSRVVGGIDGFDTDAVIAAVGVEAYNTRIGLSYDFNVSQLRPATESIGAFEVSVIYIHQKEEPGRIHYERFCPTF